MQGSPMGSSWAQKRHCDDPKLAKFVLEDKLAPGYQHQSGSGEGWMGEGAPRSASTRA